MNEPTIKPRKITAERLYALSVLNRETVPGEAMRDAAEEIDRLNAVISDGAKWVSVEERVPGEEVLTCTDEREVGMGWFDPLDGWRESGSGMRFADMGRNIDYWMPLPEAPK